jgi:hypothetical protein
MSIRATTVTLAAAAALMLATPAHAQYGRVWSDSRAYDNARQIAHDNGYREGLAHGQNAARDNKVFDLNREKDYRNGDEGYRRDYGDRDFYRVEFRRGFAEGYREAYERYGYRSGYYGSGRDRDDDRAIPRAYPQAYPNSYPVYGGTYGGYGNGYGNIAFQNGVRDGYQKGRDDARSGRYPDAQRQKWYRSGDRDYNGGYGSRDAYRLEYRRGFEQGYERAFRDLGRR